MVNAIWQRSAISITFPRGAISLKGLTITGKKARWVSTKIVIILDCSSLKNCKHALEAFSDFAEKARPIFKFFFYFYIEV